jgi:hypothetical protein
MRWAKLRSIAWGEGTRMKMTRLPAFLLFCSAGLLGAQQTPDGLQFNVPYLCGDGHTYVVHKCEKGPRFEACFYQKEQDSERYNTRQAVAAQMKTCKVQGQARSAVSAPAQPSSAPPAGVYRCTNGVTLTISKCEKLSGRDACYFKMENSEKVLIDAPGSADGVAKILRACQGERTVAQSAAPPATTSRAANTGATDSDYVADMPSVDRVKSEIKGSDPTDTLARQVAVFTYLQTYLARIRDARNYGGPFTPAEKKLFDDYYYAGYGLSQSFSKTHTPAEVKSFQLLEGGYEVNHALSWIKQLEGKRAFDAYQHTEASLAESYKRNQEQYQQRATPEHGKTSIFGIPVSDSQGILAGMNAGIENDTKVRRCLELGGSLGDCKDSGAIRLVEHWTGTASSRPPAVAGVVLVGDYSGSSGASVSFGEDLGDRSPKALVKNCGSLVGTVFADTRDYTIRKEGSVVQIAVANEPDPIVITMQPDGHLLGPGSVLAKGRVITGYSTTTTTVMVDGVRADAQGYYCNPGPCTSHSLPTPNFEPKIERCTIGPMAYAPPKPIHPKKTGIRMIDDLEPPKPLVQGFRMTGRYAGDTGLSLAFDNDTVTLDCGKAHAKAPYTVDNTPDAFVVHVQNGGGAFLLGLAPDNTLRGSGSTTVNGRLVSSIHGDNISFTPHSESCGIGTFTARSERSTMRPSGALTQAGKPH